MGSETLKLTDLYEIGLDSILSNYDRKILTRLYQPIIGLGAVSLFFTLWSELEGDQTYSLQGSTHERLFDLLQCNVYQFIEYRKKLEAVGLLTTLCKSESKKVEYIYLLKAPLMPKDFFAHPLLNALLFKYLKEAEYEKTRTYFLKVMKKNNDFMDISASYNEVFGFDKDANVSPSTSPVIGKEVGVPRLNFNFDLLYQGLKEWMIPMTLITPSIKEEILSLANMYNISAYDFRSIVASSIKTENSKRYIDVESLRRLASNTKMIKVEDNQKDKEMVELNDDSVLSSKLKLFNELSPIEFLQLRNHGLPLLKEDIVLIDNVRRKTNLTDPVINVLLDYSLIVNNNSLPSTYIMKVAGTLIRSNINSAYDAMVFFNNFRRNRSASFTPYRIEEEVKETKVVEKIKENAVINQSPGEGFRAFMDLVGAKDNGKG